MKRLQIYIGEDLDEALAVESRRRATSKAALIRSYVAERLGRPEGTDPVDELIGLVSGAPDDSASIDDVVYNQR